MCRPQAMLYTKSQLLLILNGWGCTEPLPPPGKKLLVCFPRSLMDWEIDLAEVETTSLKSDSGERLWRVVTSSSIGREIESTVQEAHVLAYRTAEIELHRSRNLARHEAFQIHA